MDDGRRPWLAVVAAAMLVPAAWSILAVALSDERLASTAGAWRVEAHVGDEVRRSPSDEPVLAVHVLAVRSAGSGAAPDADIELLVPAYAFGSSEATPGASPVRLAIVRAQRHDPATGAVVWAGWLLSDATAGRFWGLQRQILGGAAFAAIPSLAGSSLVAYALGAPRAWRRPRALDAPAWIAGASLGLLVGAGMADATSPLYPRAGDDGPIVGVAALVVLALGILSALVAHPVAPRAGGAATLAAGAGALAAPAVGLLLVWHGAVGARAALGPVSVLALGCAAIAVLGVAASRFLSLRATRSAAAALLVAPALALWWRTPLDALAMPLVLVTWMAALELLRPRWVTRMLRRLSPPRHKA